MKFKFKIFRRCPKTNRIVGFDVKSVWYWILFPIIGLGALIWFLIRVIPKPSRAAYPCQRVAMPIAAGFLGFLTGITGIAAIYRIIKNRKSFKSVQSVAKGIVFVLTLYLVVYLFVPAAFTGCGAAGSNSSSEDIPVATLPPDDNNDNISNTAENSIGLITEITEATEANTQSLSKDPTKSDILASEKYSVPSKGIGIYPGRVVYAHNPAAVKFNGKGIWWEDQYTIPEEVKKMFTESLCSLTEKNNTVDAWDALFRNFNGDGEPYKKGEKIVIKLNMNQDGGGGGSMHIPSPQLIEALVSELIHAAGANPADITITDPSRSIGDQIYNRFINNADVEMKNVRFVVQNRINAVPDKTDPIYFADGQIGYVSTDYTAAKYLINLAVFRVHDAFGVTLCGKNHFGSVKFDSDEVFVPINMHPSWDNGYGKYSHITDLIAFKHLGGKTLLYMIDGLYTAYHQGDNTVRKMKSFGNEYPSSLFMSQDPCAIDSVAYDYLSVEIALNSEMKSQMAANAPDNYIIEAAYADAPPSNTNYDPNKTGVRVSLGAYEHWNNDTDKQYSRNLGKDYGIEFIKLELD